MRDGEWLVTVGEGVGIPSAILAMAKRLSWNDWLLFSEKCGMPVIIGKTAAQRGTAAWDQLARAIRAVAPKTGLVADTGSDIAAVPMGAGGGKDTYRELVETVDRAISALYRGGDLATVSGGPDSAGVNAQEGESELMDADGCAMVSETLRDQVEKFVVRFECGDFEPLAEIVVNPPAETEDIHREIKIDTHLAGLGVRLSKSDALARYGRTEATGDGDALELRQPANPGGFGGIGLPNEAPAPQAPSSAVAKALQNARKGEGATDIPPNAAERSTALLRDFAADMAPAAAKIKSLLDMFDGVERGTGNGEQGTDEAMAAVRKEARKLAAELPDLMPDDPAMAAALEEAMAQAFAEGVGGEALANSEKCPECGQWLDGNGVCHECRGADEAAERGVNPDNDTVQAAEIGKGKAAIRKCLAEHVDMPDAVCRGDIGTISILYGSPVDTPEGKAWGLSHFAQRKDTVGHLPETLIRGEAQKPYQDGQKRNIVLGRYTAVLALANDPEKPGKPKRWILSAFQPSDQKSEGGHR